jgi:regulator of cell morphogenesis and NO signaling
LSWIKARQAKLGYGRAFLMPTSITPNTTIGEIVVARPQLASVFERLGIDYCCGGKRTIAQVCATKSLDAATVVAMLDSVAHATTVTPSVDPTSMSLTALADHIETTHHAYLKDELPGLVEKAERVAAKHAWRDPRLPEVARVTLEFAQEMFSHMEKEERILFPLVRTLEKRQGGAGSIADPVRQMEAEHDSAGNAMERLHELTNAFTPDGDSCNTHRALLSGLARLEADLHQHVHKENNVLFPRAVAFEAELAR